MNMNPTEPQFNHIVAFEVSKTALVVHTLPADRQQTIDNSAAAVRRLLRVEQRANLNIPTIMVAEKVADMILSS